MDSPASFEGAHDVVRVDAGLVTIEAKGGRLARRRSRVEAPVTWPADRVTVSFARTDGSGRWLATFTYEGQSAVLAMPSAALDALAVFATDHLGGTTNTVADAEADRVRRRRL